jgi:hypothetical protein
MTVCCQNLPLDALSSRSVPSVLAGAIFKNFGLFLNTGLRQVSFCSWGKKMCFSNYIYDLD